MASLEQNRKKQEQLAFDDDIFRPNPENRVSLPGEDETFFQEEQAFDQIWLWAILGLELIIVLIPLLMTRQPLWVNGMAVGAMVMTFALLGGLRLRTRIDREGVHYQMKIFHLKERTIPWEEIDQIYVRKYSPILEYGGWGIRYGRKGRAYNVKGNYGIQLVLKNEKRILLGTQIPEEASSFLSRYPLLV